MTKPISRQQSGFGQVIVLVLLLAVLAVIIFIGYRIYDNQLTDKVTSDITSQSDDTAAPTIQSTSDLDKASAMLDQVNPDSNDQGDASTLDAEFNKF